MSTNHYRKCNYLEACKLTGENSLGCKTLCFLGQCCSWGRRSRVSVSAVPRLDLGKLLAKSAQDCSDSSACTSKSPEHFWKKNCAQDCSESSKTVTVTFGAAPGLRGQVPIVSAVRTLVDLARRSCYAGLQPAETKRMDIAARRKA